jgi:hypothetical protein
MRSGAKSGDFAIAAVAQMANAPAQTARITVAARREVGEFGGLRRFISNLFRHGKKSVKVQMRELFPHFLKSASPRKKMRAPLYYAMSCHTRTFPVMQRLLSSRRDAETGHVPSDPRGDCLLAAPRE